jgi:hypothetical protein
LPQVRTQLPILREYKEKRRVRYIGGTYVASHPAVTAITPSTSRASNMADNMGGAIGRLPDTTMRKRMIALVDNRPAA